MRYRLGYVLGRAVRCLAGRGLAERFARRVERMRRGIG